MYTVRFARGDVTDWADLHAGYGVSHDKAIAAFEAANNG